MDAAHLVNVCQRGGVVDAQEDFTPVHGAGKACQRKPGGAEFKDVDVQSSLLSRPETSGRPTLAGGTPARAASV